MECALVVLQVSSLCVVNRAVCVLSISSCCAGACSCALFSFCYHACMFNVRMTQTIRQAFDAQNAVSHIFKRNCGLGVLVLVGCHA